MKLYLFSGLGADASMFESLALPEHVSIVHIPWIEPYKRETMQDYCKRLMEKMDLSQPFLLGGLSFGGCVAIEMSKLVKPERIIIISGFKGRRELPGLYKFLGYIRLHKIVPPQLVKRPTPLTWWLFGAKKQESRAILRRVMKSSSPNYMRWALSQVLSWDNDIPPVPVFHIHGTADRILPFKNIKADAAIEGAGHLMEGKMEEIGRVLRDIL